MIFEVAVAGEREAVPNLDPFLTVHSCLFYLVFRKNHFAQEQHLQYQDPRIVGTEHAILLLSFALSQDLIHGRICAHCVLTSPCLDVPLVR